MATGTIRMICPNLRCRAILSVPGTARGRNVRCRSCGQKVAVPATSKTPAKTPPAAEPETQTSDSKTTES